MAFTENFVGGNGYGITSKRDQTRRDVLRGVAGGITTSVLLGRASGLGAAQSGSDGDGAGQYLGTTGPAAVYRYDGSSWAQLGDDIDSAPASVTDVVRYEGDLYAGVTTDKTMGVGTGQVWRYGDNSWKKVGDSLQHEVAMLTVYDGDLYAGTSYGTARLYRFESSGSWSNVVDEENWEGFVASHVFDGDLYLGDSLYDKFGRFDGSSFTEEADQGGSCIFDIVAHDGDLFGAALSGVLYKRNGGDWDRVRGYDDNYGLFVLGVYGGTLYAGDERGKLHEWTGDDLEEVHEFDDSVVAMEGTGDGLFIGTGVNAAEYTGTSKDEGIATVSRFEDGSVSAVSDTDQFGDAAQVLTAASESQTPSLARVEWPAAALTPEEPPTYRLRVDPVGTDPESVDVSAEGSARLSNPRRKSPFLETADVSETTTTVTEDGLVEIEVQFPGATDIQNGSVVGRRLTYLLTVSVDGQTVYDDVERTRNYGSPESYVFEKTDTVACITARASDRTLGNLRTAESDPGLFAFMRAKAEYLNQFWANGLGNMGAKGFKFEFVTDVRNPPSAVEEGWLTLDDTWSEYQTSGTATGFMDEALATAHEHLDIDWTRYDTSMVVNEGKGSGSNRLSNPFWMGRLPPNIELSFDLLDIEFDTDDIDLPVVPRDLPDDAAVDKIDSIYEIRTGDAWRHEFGHAMGPGNQIRFPEMYDPNRFNSPVSNLGVIGDWGIMDEGDVVCGFIRSAIGRSVTDASFDGRWLDIASSVHLIDDTSVTMDEPLTEKRLGDELNWLFSMWAEVAVDIDVDTPEFNLGGGDLFSGDFDVSVEVNKSEPKLGIYIFEERTGAETNVQLPSRQDPLYTSPSDHGIALYRFDTLKFDELPTLEEIKDSNKTPSIEVSSDSIELDYQPPTAGASAVSDSRQSTNVTLSSATKTTYTDPPSGATFHLDRDPSQTDEDAKVTAERDVADIIENIDDSADRVISIVAEYVRTYLKEAINHTEEPIPGPEILVETPGGKRTGVIPETGELVNEIDGAIINGPASNPTVSVPASEDISVSITAKRLRRHLRDHGVEPPEYVLYDRTVIVDDGSDVVERDGVPFIEGRTTHRAPGVAGTDDEQPAITGAPIEIKPPQINAKSNGKWVTAWIGLPKESSVDDLLLEATTLASVPAVSDEKYGFVKNPETEARDGKRYVKVKFPRQPLVDELGAGEHAAGLTGQVGNTTFHGSATLEIKGGGKSNGNGNGKGKGNGKGNGNGNGKKRDK